MFASCAPPTENRLTINAACGSQHVSIPRVPSRLPQIIAVAVVVLLVSLVVVVGAEIGRGVAERRLGTT